MFPDSSSFKPDDTVMHVRYGTGRILKEWGAFRDTDPTDGRSLDINGTGIFEVRFGQEIHSVNGSSLSLVEPAPSFHPFAEKFPKLSDEDYAVLRSSIQKNGLLSPIVISEGGEILDGRHRWLACRELGITPRTIQFSEVLAESPGTLSAEQFIYSVNAERRHLLPSQRAALALEFLPLARKEAAVRARAAQARGRLTQRANRLNGKVINGGPPKYLRGPTTNAVLAARAGVGIPTMKAVVAVHDHAPQLLSEITNGHLSASEAAKLIRKNGKILKGAMDGNAPSLEKKTILCQWKKTWEAFLKRYPEKQHKLVREIISEYFRQEKAQLS